MKTLMFAAVLSTFALTALAKTPIGIVLHGGAGTISKDNMTAAQEQAYHAMLAHAIHQGYSILERGGSSVDAVTAAVTVLEDSPLFNAGKGAVYTFDESHELDASIMDGRNRNAGAVAGVTNVKNPILLARAVMEKSVHVMLSGKGAEQFASEQQLELVDNRYFNTQFRYDALKRAKQALVPQPHQAAVPYDPAWKMGTVGAVAIDREGNLAAATSTGGMTAKRYGRIGDAPVIGAGNFADNASCAVSATGHGEYFIRYQVASDICARVKYQKMSAAAAAKQVLAELKQVGGDGGVVVVDNKGQLSWSFNTEGMYRARKSEGGELVSEIFASSN
ncbi:MAG: isoaspartyl peptidase/L-asparaginase [Gammaproteobacteria bacterium]|nr:isoaspartyl peptidase/L-asparaginase [Gammaproteobacteria bacterium]MBU1555603.1 isoaspartyl peptidase/L-asparaginase [Gammaproteobacteria bacterium]MBU2070313.1 isoaspartyl peptidase/L-asparaginase [Gammaproteobacteria bacterium]MBU2183040.1 isoaspartyl peptidase/L-asparaginase [Gammaproteobacteria bacterium]MBU2203156.1 isoaspartyl peptidase/L-asparaginase [Gammaproteobacteria bacterium]